MNKKTTWASLKKYLLAVAGEYEDRNGLGYCKNCGVDVRQLVETLDVLLAKNNE